MLTILTSKKDTSFFHNSQLFRHEITFIGLAWLLVGYVEEDKVTVDDPAFYLTQLFGRLGFLIYLVCTTIVALNMLITMMNNSFERVMVGLKLWFVTDFDLK